SIKETDLVELVGWRGLLDTVLEASPKERFDAAVASRVNDLDPRSLLDYGCGKPRSLPALAEGRAMTVFDVDASLAPAWAGAAPRGSDEGASRAPPSARPVPTSVRPRRLRARGRAIDRRRRCRAA